MSISTVEGFWESVETRFEKADWGFNLDMALIVGRFATLLYLEMSCPEFGVVIIFVPAETHHIINPLETVNCPAHGGAGLVSGFTASYRGALPRRSRVGIPDFGAG